jgi:hypothetical protein
LMRLAEDVEGGPYVDHVWVQWHYPTGLPKGVSSFP